MWHGLSLAYVPCAMSYHNLCATLHVIYSCHMAWPKPCLIAIWHILDLAYVQRGMVRLSLNAIWHG
jgi:hypothetical protein